MKTLEAIVSFNMENIGKSAPSVSTQATTNFSKKIRYESDEKIETFQREDRENMKLEGFKMP